MFSAFFKAFATLRHENEIVVTVKLQRQLFPKVICSCREKKDNTNLPNKLLKKTCFFSVAPIPLYHTFRPKQETSSKMSKKICNWFTQLLTRFSRTLDSVWCLNDNLLLGYVKAQNNVHYTQLRSQEFSTSYHKKQYIKSSCRTSHNKGSIHGSVHCKR